MPVWLGALAGVAALLASAKAHGRQVRLEREREGYHHVVFGGENPAYVESLWRADRVRFWSFVPPAALALGALAWWWDGAPLALVAALLWAPSLGFWLAGMLSLARLRLRGGRDHPSWWMLSAGLLAASATLALV